MLAPIKVGVKFCGNCNPHIPGKSTFQEIRDKVKAYELNVEFVPWHITDLKLLLVISGCPTDCAGRPPGNLAEIVVAGETVNYKHCNSGNISQEVANCILKYK